MRPLSSLGPLLVLAASTACAVACSSSADAPAADAGDAATDTADAFDATPPKVVQGDAPWEKPGSAPVGVASGKVEDVARGRTLPLTVFYPAAESARAAATTGVPIESLAGDQQAAYAKLLAADGRACATRTVHAAVDAAPAAATALPTLVFSHCHSCTRLSVATMAERLASHGFLVVALDHQGNTVWDALAGKSAELSAAFLATRAADVRFVLDRVLDGSALPASLAGKADPAKVGVFGHSFGAATTGLVLARDPRVRAGLAIFAPMENDLLPPAKMAEIKVPAAFLLAREDNSISEIGNNIIRSNHKLGNPPLWLFEIADAGHWSLADVDGLHTFAAGCGVGERQTEPGTPFAYLDPGGARALGASYVTAFFAATLGADAAAKAFLAARHPSGVVDAKVRE